MGTASSFPLLERICAFLPSDLAVYVVGGAVRDYLLQREVHDWDFVVEGNAIKTARRVANQMGGAFYVLNEDFGAARVILTEPPVTTGDNIPKKVVLDFNALRTPDLESDLRARDLTINAIALDIHHLTTLIDPLKGAADLHQKRLRACSEQSFQSDPVRILRAVRMACTFGYQITPETRNLMRAAASRLAGCSPERVRDEFLRILGGVHPATALRILDMLDILPHFLPEIEAMKGTIQTTPHVYDVWNHTLAALDKLEDLLSTLSPAAIPNPDSGYSSSLTMGLAAMRLGRYREKIWEHFQSRDSADVQRRALLFMAALYHDSGKPAVGQVDSDGRVRFLQHESRSSEIVSRRALSLHMSSQEIEIVKTITANHMRPLQLNQTPAPPSRRAIYRFFRSVGECGVDVCILSLADHLATYDYNLQQSEWRHLLDTVRSLLDGWWEPESRVVSLPALINGNEVMQLFDLHPGAKIGELLEAVREAQAAGELTSHEQAVEYVRGILTHF